MQYLRLIGKCGILALAGLALISTWACASSHYSLATSSSSLYILQTGGNWGGKSYVQLSGFGTGSSLSGVAARDEYVFVADNASNGLYIAKMKGALNGTPTLEFVTKDALGNPAPIKLQNAGNTLHVDKPTSVIVDKAGGVYVVGGAYDGGARSSYAYLTAGTNGWSNPTISVVDIGSAPIQDIAAMGTSGGAAMVHQLIGSAQPGQSYVSTLSSGSVTVANRDLGSGAYNPQAVAVDPVTGLVYIANRTMDSTLSKGSISVYNPTTNTISTTGLALSMIPDDITTFAVGGQRYAGIIGTLDESAQEAWIIPLDANGQPSISATRRPILPADFSNPHQIATSADGSVFWYTNWQSGTVEARNTMSWSTIPGFSGSLGSTVNVGFITDYEPVPEPSSLMCLLAMAGGTVGMMRRRRK